MPKAGWQQPGPKPLEDRGGPQCKNTSSTKNVVVPMRPGLFPLGLICLDPFCKSLAPKHSTIAYCPAFYRVKIGGAKGIPNRAPVRTLLRLKPGRYAMVITISSMVRKLGQHWVSTPIRFSVWCAQALTENHKKGSVLSLLIWIPPGSKCVRSA